MTQTIINNGVNFRALAATYYCATCDEMKSADELVNLESPASCHLCKACVETQMIENEAKAEEETPKTETVYVNVVDTAKLIRKDLKANFPNQKFSVRSDKYAGGASVDIIWTDGIDTPSVDAVVQQYKGAHFDGMIDLQTYVSHEKDGKLYRYGSDYVSCHREISNEIAIRIANDVAKLAGMEMTGINEISGVSCPQMGYLRWGDIAHRLSYKFNLDNYGGVKERTGCWPGNELDWELY